MSTSDTSFKDAVQRAVENGNVSKVKELFEDDSTKVDLTEKYGENRQTLLHLAVWGRHDDIFNFLLEKILENGCNSIINEFDRGEDTALHLTAIKDNAKACKKLLEAGADISIVNQKWNTAFHEACKQSDTAICNLMLGPCKEKGILEKKAKNGDTPLLIAAKHDKPEVFRLLLEEGANYQVVDGEGNNVMHIAALRSCVELFKILVDKDHDHELLSVPDKDGNTPLHIAADRNNPEICTLLLDSGCKLNTKNKQGNTALHIASKTVINISAEMVDEKKRDNASKISKQLLDKNADWKLKNKNDDTALHLAARNVNVPICDMLLERGATCFVLEENMNEHVPYDLVPTSKRYKIGKLKTETETARFNKLEKESGTTPVKNIKLFFCGEQAVGKTTLRRALSKGRFSSWIPGRRNPQHIATPGVNVKPKNIRGAGKFVIWDMAGQIEYHVTHAMLLGSSLGVFMVVFDMTWSMDKKKKKLMYWLSFIKAGHKVKVDGFRTPIVVVGTHADKLKENAQDEYKKTQSLLDDIINLFEDFLDIHKELMMTNGRKCRSRSIRELKDVIRQVAEPLRLRTTPNICADVSKQMAKWVKKRSKLPIMHFKEFKQMVNKEVNHLADESLVRLVLAYLNDQGELHQAKVKPGGDQAAENDLIILNPNWLTTTIFGPIFAKPEFRDDYRGFDCKQVYTLKDLRDNFYKIEDPRLLVDLLEYFELAFKKDDESFVLPVKLPEDVKEIDWTGHDKIPNIVIYGIRIECRDETDMFTSDTFPCLQVRAMNQYKHSTPTARRQHADPRLKLSHRGLKVCKDVEGMIQLTKDRRAIHLAVRMKESEVDEGYKQLCGMKEMAFFQLNERSIGTQVNVLYLSPLDMMESTDLEENVHWYEEDDLQDKMKNTEDLVHPTRTRKESIADVTGWKAKDILTNIKTLNSAEFAIDEPSDKEYIVETDNKSLHALAQEIATNDRDALGRHLGLKDSKIFSIKNDFPDSTTEQTYQMLVCWRNMQGTNVNTEELKEAFVTIKRNDLAYGNSESAKMLSNDKLESIVHDLDYRQWQHLAIRLECPADDVYEKEKTAHVFIKWRRQRSRNVDVVKYMAAGLKSIGRSNLASNVESKY